VPTQSLLALSTPKLRLGMLRLQFDVFYDLKCKKVGLDYRSSPRGGRDGSVKQLQHAAKSPHCSGWVWLATSSWAQCGSGAPWPRSTLFGQRAAYCKPCWSVSRAHGTCNLRVRSSTLLNQHPNASCACSVLLRCCALPRCTATPPCTHSTCVYHPAPPHTNRITPIWPTISYLTCRALSLQHARWGQQQAWWHVAIGCRPGSRPALTGAEARQPPLAHAQKLPAGAASEQPLCTHTQVNDKVERGDQAQVQGGGAGSGRAVTVVAIIVARSLQT
jgi:hypothetical protein